MDSNTNSNDGRRFKWGREIGYQFAGDLIRTTDPKELEAKRLAIIAEEAEDERLDEIWNDERNRLIKEWKIANPESKTHPYMTPVEWVIATNAPCGWANDFHRLEGVLNIDREQYYQLAQQAMDEGGNPAYAKFTENMYAIANAEGQRLHKGLGFKPIVCPSWLAKAEAKRSNEGGAK
jgi:hypothetical protein